MLSCPMVVSVDSVLLYFQSAVLVSIVSPADSYGAFLQVNEGEPVYDFCWYPCMSLSGG